MNYSECTINARNRIGKYCKACPECNGRACRNQIPGPGAKGIGDTAIRNYDKWKEIRVNMDTISENRPVDTSLELFGREFKYPFFAGPVLFFGRRPRIIEVNFCLRFSVLKG